MCRGSVAVADLTEALGEYQDAVADERAFLEEATEIEAVAGVDDESTNDDINDAIDAAVVSAAGSVQSELSGYGNTGFKNYDFTAASDAVRAQIVSEFRTQLEKDVADTKSDVEDTAGLLSKANTLVSASAAYESAAAQLGAAKTGLEAEAAKFDVANGSAVTSVPASSFNNLDVTNFSDYTVGDYIKAEGGKLVITDAGKNLVGIDALLAAAQAEYQALLTEANAQTRLESAIEAVLRAEAPEGTNFFAEFNSFDAADVTSIAAFAIGPATDLSGTYTVSIDGTDYTFTAAADATPVSIGAGLAAAIGDQASADSTTGVITILGAQNGDVTTSAPTDVAGGTATQGTAYTAPSALSNYYTEFNYTTPNLEADGSFDADVDVSSATGNGALFADNTSGYFGAQSDLNSFNEAVQNFQAIAQVQADSAELAQAVADALEAVEEFGVELNTSGVGTEADDLFVFADAELDISGFGLQGDDLLYIGEGFTEQRLAGDVTTDRLGDSATLEVFFQQDGNNAVIYVENEAFAGNARSDADLTKITLTGVSIDDLQFENGFVSIVEAA